MRIRKEDNQISRTIRLNGTFPQFTGKQLTLPTDFWSKFYTAGEKGETKNSHEHGGEEDLE